eukprot:COSAG02_NODE_15423_length_1172_cov_5.352283_1_plen_69_part_00
MMVSWFRGLEAANIELTMVVRSDCVPAHLRGGRLAKCYRVRADLLGTRLTIQIRQLPKISLFLFKQTL